MIFYVFLSCLHVHVFQNWWSEGVSDRHISYLAKSLAFLSISLNFVFDYMYMRCGFSKGTGLIEIGY